MTIPVSIEQLPQALPRFASATLITKADPYVKLLTVDPQVEGGAVVVEGIHNSTRENVARDPHVTLVWQPLVRHGWTLIVDGTGQVRGDRLIVTLESGMLHRPSAHEDGPEWVWPQQGV
jgi:hypothetical protein